MKMARWVGLIMVVVGLIGVGLPESARTQSATNYSIWTLVWSQDGQKIAAGYETGIVEIRNVATGQIITTFDKLSAPVSAIAWNSSGSRILTGGWSNLFIWNPANGQIIKDLTSDYGSADRITEVSWNENDTQFIVYTVEPYNKELRIWNDNTYRYIEKDAVPVTEIVWSISKKTVVGGVFNGGAILLNPATFDMIGFADDDHNTAVALSPGGQRVVTGTWRGSIRLWNIPSFGPRNAASVWFEPTYTLRKPTGEPDPLATYVRGLVFSLSGNRVYSVLGSGELAAWDANNGVLISTTQLENAPISAAAFNQLGTKLAYGDANGELHIVDVATLVPPETYGELPTFFRISDGQAANRLLQ